MPKPEDKKNIRFGVDLSGTPYEPLLALTEEEILGKTNAWIVMHDEDKHDKRDKQIKGNANKIMQKLMLSLKKDAKIPLTKHEKTLDGANNIGYAYSIRKTALQEVSKEEQVNQEKEKYQPDLDAVLDQIRATQEIDKEEQVIQKKENNQLDADALLAEFQQDEYRLDEILLDKFLQDEILQDKFLQDELGALELEIKNDQKNDQQKQAQNPARVEVDEKRKITKLTNRIFDKLSESRISSFNAQLSEIEANVENADTSQEHARTYLTRVKRGLIVFGKTLNSGKGTFQERLDTLDKVSKVLSVATKRYQNDSLKLAAGGGWTVFNQAELRKELDEKNKDEVIAFEKKEKYKVKTDNIVLDALEDMNADDLKDDNIVGRNAIHEAPEPEKTLWQNMNNFWGKLNFFSKKKKEVQTTEKQVEELDQINIFDDEENKDEKAMGKEDKKENPKPEEKGNEQQKVEDPKSEGNNNDNKEVENKQDPAEANNVNDPKVPENVSRNEDNNDNKKKVENPNPAEADDKKDLDKKDNLNQAEPPKEKEKEKDKDKVEEKEKEKDKDKVEDKEKEEEKDKVEDKEKDDNKDKENNKEPVQADVKENNVQNVPDNNQPEQNVNQNQENIDKNVEEKNDNEKQKDNALEEKSVVDPIRRAKTMEEYEDGLLDYADTNNVVLSDTLMRGEKNISELDKAALQTKHNKMMQGENKLRALLPEKLDRIDEAISIPGLIRNQMLLEEGGLSPDQKFNHYRNILAIKDMDGDKYSKQLMDYRLKVAEEAGREFDKKHQDPSKLSFLNKSANAIENVMCAMSRNPLGIGVLLVAAVNAPLLIVGLLAFTAWKRKRPNPEYQQAWKEQNQRELETKRQQLAKLYGCNASDLSDREVTKALKADYVHSKVVEALDEKLERDSKKEVDKITKDYAKAISKGSKDKFKAKDVKELVRKKSSDAKSKKDLIDLVDTNREKRLENRILDVRKGGPRL